jgi:hypothetical protein
MVQQGFFKFLPILIFYLTQISPALIFYLTQISPATRLTGFRVNPPGWI